MDIVQITDILNEAIGQKGGDLCEIQRYRVAAKPLKKAPTSTLFGRKGVKEQENYAFHCGGRDELQFNLGFLDFDKDGQHKLYYGVAISFEPSREISEPLVHFEPLRQRLNDFIRTEPLFFKGYVMFHQKGKHENNTRAIHGPYQVSEVPTPQLNDFYVIGRISDGPQSPDSPVFQDIIEVFEHLFPVYWRVTFDDAPLVLDTRLARLCYNTNGWISPSGPEGKSPSKEAYEQIQSYGHEEWFFDLDKLIDGWHYAYLRPIQLFWGKYAGHRFNLKLYTRDANSAQYLYVGEVDNLEVITPSEAARIKELYIEKGWLFEMLEQANQYAPERVYDLNDFLNVRFRPSEARRYDSPQPVPKGDIPFHRYMLYLSKSNDNPEPVVQISKPFTPRKPSQEAVEILTAKEIVRQYQDSTTFQEDIHSAIVLGLHQYIDEKYPNSTDYEVKTSDNTRIDLKFCHPGDNKFLLFEIKTYDELRTCIRHALGQLLEYAWADNFSDLSGLIIVSQHFCDPATEQYLQFLRETLHLPIGYISFDWQAKSVRQSLYLSL